MMGEISMGVDVVVEVGLELISVDERIVDFEISSESPIKPYTGEYTVTPKVTEQYLSTKELRMTDDVTVKRIPTHEVSNDFGTTMIIGGIL